ncbi:MAG: plasmid segregation protein ParM domain-containing protein [Neisseriaceae bacterium]|jgi:hypothetical protein
MHIYVSSDDGHNSIKTCYPDNNGEVKTFITENNTATKNLDTVKTENQDYFCSTENLAIHHYNLYKSGLENREIVLITTLPFEKFYVKGQPNNDLIYKKKQNLLRTDITPLHNRIIENFVMANGVSGYFDLLYDNNSYINEEISTINKEKLITIVDCGYNATDIITFDNGKIDFQRSGSFDRGSVHLKNRIKDTIISSKSHGFTDIPNNILDKIMHEKIIGAGNFTLEVDKCKKEIAIEIRNYITRKIGSMSEVGIIYFIGGTSILLKDQLMEFYNNKTSYFPDNALYSNATGMLKYLLRAK